MRAVHLCYHRTVSNGHLSKGTLIEALYDRVSIESSDSRPSVPRTMLLQLGESLAALNFNGLKPENHPTRSPCIEIVALLRRQFSVYDFVTNYANHKLQIINYKS